MLVRHPQNGRTQFARDVLASIAGFAVLAAAFTTWYLSLSKEDESFSREVHRLDHECAIASNDLDDARRLYLHDEAFLDKARRVADERYSDDWTPALRSIAVSAGPDIELKVIHVWTAPDDPRGHLLRIEGSSTGSVPRMVADRFLQRLKHDLERYFKVSENCRFERLDDEPQSPATVSGQGRAVFTIIAPIAPEPPPKTPGDSRL